MAKLDPEKWYWASFNRFEARLPGQAVLDIARSGSNVEAVAQWAGKLQLYRATKQSIRDELREEGAWSGTDLSDDTQNLHRLTWLAAWDIAECDEPDCTDPLLEPLEEALAEAMQDAWNEHCEDSGTIPACFSVHGSKTARVQADFRGSQFAHEVARELEARGFGRSTVNAIRLRWILDHVTNLEGTENIAGNLEKFTIPATVEAIDAEIARPAENGTHT